jgi:amino acid transporter
VIGGRRPLTGRKPGDRRVLVARPHTAFFRYADHGRLVAKPAASEPRTPAGRLWRQVKTIVLGPPLASEDEIDERLSKKKALAIFSSDAISSSAYATEEILRVLVVGGAAAFLVSVEVAAAIAGLLAVVAISYRQVCLVFPNGGGAYAVARSELTPLLALIAAAALLIDYVMTVAVSTSSAVDQLISVSPGLNPLRVEIALAAIALITIANLRGLRESGNIFALPTYLFIGLALTVVAIGVVRIVLGDVSPWPRPEEAMPLGTEPIGLFLILRAFASGSVALTGTEAIANGVPAFKPPEPRNAATTMVAMAVLLAILFVGITVVADAYQIVPSEEGSGGPTVIALVAQTAFGVGTPLFYIFQGATALILFLAANTSYNAFPRLGALLARDGYMPRQFSFRGDRLAFSWGIVLLALVAGTLIVAFGGITTFLIPLYSVGVFACFTISQAGMVRHWLRTRAGGWPWRMAINLTGAIMTAIVLAVVVSVKFVNGAWLVVILVPTLVTAMHLVRRQYARMDRSLQVRSTFVAGPPRRDERVIVPIPGINRAVVQAINVGRSIADDVRAVFISDDPEATAALQRDWERTMPGVPLVVVESPYRALAGPLSAYLDVLDAAWPPDKEAPITFVVLPEYVARHWWERLLYNQSTKSLRRILLGRPGTVVVDVPYRREAAAA